MVEIQLYNYCRFKALQRNISGGNNKQNNKKMADFLTKMSLRVFANYQGHYIYLTTGPLFVQCSIDGTTSVEAEPFKNTYTFVDATRVLEKQSNVVCISEHTNFAGL